MNTTLNYDPMTSVALKIDEARAALGADATEDELVSALMARARVDEDLKRDLVRLYIEQYLDEMVAAGEAVRHPDGSYSKAV